MTIMLFFVLCLVLFVVGIVYFIKAKKNQGTDDKYKQFFKGAGISFVLYFIYCISEYALFMLGFLFLIFGVGYLIYSFIKKQPKKKAVSIIVVSLLMCGSSVSTTPSTDNTSSDTAPKVSHVKKVEKAEVGDLSQTDAQAWCDQNGFTLDKEENYSDTVAQGGFISQSPTAGTKLEKGSTITVYYSKGKAPTVEDKNALAKAESYSTIMHMSKAGIYDQLTSSYGEGFSQEAAQYAIDHLVADYKKNALEKAKEYQSTMHMSRQSVYEQLTSSYGEKFTAEEAQYAIDNLPQ